MLSDIRRSMSLLLAGTALVLTAPLAAEPKEWDPADWDLEHSEFEPDGDWLFGRLDNGMRYIVRSNDRPEGTAELRMEIAAGSLDERADELGYAHYVEHMAFNGSTNVPEGEMIKLLERLGLSFGADTNASTGLERTQYRLSLPNTDPGLLDTALMLMRETASELTFDEDAVQREKGVILSERRVRNSYQLRNVVDGLEFLYPQALAPDRLPIGELETLEAADAVKLRAFWEREYVPADTVIVLVGDVDPQAAAAMIEERFGDWRPAASPDQPDGGPVNIADNARTDIYLDPALSETVSLTRHEEWEKRLDTRATRERELLLSVARGIVGRRLQALQRSEDPPFQGVNLSTSDFFEAARSTSLSVSSEEGGWQRALDAAIVEVRSALEYGFTDAEVAEQVANLRTGFENAAANAATRSHGAYMGQAFAMTRGIAVPVSPQEQLAAFEAFVPTITPDSVLAALREDAADLGDPLIRFTGKIAPQGGEAALRRAAEAALSREIAAPEARDVAEFAYTDFGAPGTVVSDVRELRHCIRQVRFANGVMLNLKQTDLSDDRVSVSLALDGGRLLATRDDPLAVELSGLLPAGGLGEHSRDELQSINAGRSVRANFGAGGDVFTMGAVTTPRDLERQLQVMTATVTDPGYRAEGLAAWRRSLPDFFARLGRTPGSALGEAIGPALSDNDPRFTRAPIEAYQALDYDTLAAFIGDRLENGAIEIGIVGDIDEDAAIALAARTFGALPEREVMFRDSPQARQRSFTDDRRTVRVRHEGEADQAEVRYIWPTADLDDWELTSRLTLLSRVVRLALTDTLREELGQTYSPSASSSQSDVYEDYGTFSVGAQVDVGDVAATREAIESTLRALIDEGVNDDLLDRARTPSIENLENRLKTNASWMSYVARSQSKPERLQRYDEAIARQLAITPAELQALAARYLDPAQAVVFVATPSAATPAAADE